MNKTYVINSTNQLNIFFFMNILQLLYILSIKFKCAPRSNLFRSPLLHKIFGGLALIITYILTFKLIYILNFIMLTKLDGNNSKKLSQYIIPI